ncbi:MAG: ABC transporter ATP-binding protein [Microbacteriaceae bacterium]
MRSVVSEQTTGEASVETAPPGTIELINVVKTYGNARAVDDLTLRIEPGEFISLLGPSGCGKTTTLRMIAGFEYPDAGDIRISGKSVVGVAPYLRDVNTVFQAYALFPHLSVAENVAYGLQQRRVAKAELRERVSAALDMVQMRSFADRKPSQLSGGQQQRIAVARALVNRPSVLLLDEPLGALDRQLREEMQLELKILQSRLGITFLFVTHDQSEALSMSDRIAVMRAGRIEQLADPTTIYAAPTSAYVAAFVGQQNFIPGTMRDDGRSVDTAFGVAVRAAAYEPAISAGIRVQVAIRPEFVGISADAKTVDAAENTVRGTVLTVANLGEVVQFLVSLDDTTTMLVRRPAADAPRLAMGDAVTCSWSDERVMVFPSEDSTTGSPPASTN